MIRRYSGPRTFSPGWTRPLPFWAMKDAGLTTIPSPPASVISSHQAVAAAREASSARSTKRRSVGRVQAGVPGAAGGAADPVGARGREAVALLELPGVAALDERLPLGGEQVERCQAQV